MTSIIPIVLSGGGGSRLWPLSREMFPKQFLRLCSGQSLLQETVSRFCSDAYGAPLIVCNDEHRFIIAEQMREIGVVPRSIVLEPVGRNTAPAVAVAAMMVAESDPEAMLLVLPADHLIKEVDDLLGAVHKTIKSAARDALVTFGVEPHKPETGFGYILRGEAIEGEDGCYAVERFVEKPDQETARAFVEDGRYLWNSGMFLFSARAYLEQLEALNPEIMQACREAIAAGAKDLDFYRLDAEAFARSPSESIDIAVMELAKNVAVAPIDLGWSDIGTWSALWDIGTKDDQGNVVGGDVIALDTQDSYIHTTAPLVAALGLKDVVIAATEDAVLVAHRDKSQDVRRIVDHLKHNSRSEHQAHTKVYRPWGWYETLSQAPGFKVKVIFVNPGASLSMQYHDRRAEHWVVVEGRAKVSRGDDVFELAENESTYIPVGLQHRLENVCEEGLRIVEVQSGDYLEEDDVYRVDDKYGRF